MYNWSENSLSAVILQPPRTSELPGLKQGDQIAQRAQVKPSGRAVDALAWTGRRKIGPFPCDGEGAAIRVPKDQRIDAGDASRLQHSKALTLTGMKRMSDLGPTRSLAGRMCS